MSPDLKKAREDHKLKYLSYRTVVFSELFAPG